MDGNLGPELGTYDMATYDGHFGSSILVPADNAFGVWALGARRVITAS